MIVSINQPAYLPWLGYFERIFSADLHVVLDHVQFEKNSFINRNKIITNNDVTWLTVPVRTSGKFGNLPINQVEIAGHQWIRKHRKSLEQQYAKAPCFSEVWDVVGPIYDSQWTKLCALLTETDNRLMSILGIKTPIYYSSELNVDGNKSDLLVNICRNVGADVYLSGALGKDYLDEQLFERDGIKVIYQNYNHPEYHQQETEEFISHLSVVDLLFRYGNESLSILAGESGNQ